MLLLTYFLTKKFDSFPLQTALINGTTPHVLEYLIETNKISSSVLDIDGKTSLHLAFDAYDKVGDDVNPYSFTILEYLPEVIGMVCSLNPSHILKEDKDGMNVLEYAIEKDVDYAILRRLQKISMGIRKNKTPLEVKCVKSPEVKGSSEKTKIKFFKQFVNNKGTRAKIVAGRSA